MFPLNCHSSCPIKGKGSTTNFELTCLFCHLDPKVTCAWRTNGDLYANDVACDRLDVITLNICHDITVRMPKVSCVTSFLIVNCYCCIVYSVSVQLATCKHVRGLYAIYTIRYYSSRDIVCIVIPFYRTTTIPLPFRVHFICVSKYFCVTEVSLFPSSWGRCQQVTDQQTWRAGLLSFIQHPTTGSTSELLCPETVIVHGKVVSCNMLIRTKRWLFQCFEHSGSKEQLEINFITFSRLNNSGGVLYFSVSNIQLEVNFNHI